MKRTSIHIDSFKHANPIPAATRLGPLLVSSVIVGRDPATSQLPDRLEAQCAHIFTHVRAILAKAGAKPEDVVKMEFWVPDPAQGRAVINAEWTRMFPDLDACPARHTHAGGPGEQRISATFMAYIDPDRR
ncbi:MAG: RidA family protein [Stellaceae bacterium]